MNHAAYMRMISGSIVVLAFGCAVGCETPSAATAREESAPEAQPPTRPTFDRPARVRYHMDRQVDDLRAIERDLLAGRLGAAKLCALGMTRPEQDRGMSPWSARSTAFVDAAASLAIAPSVDEALRREVRVAQACAECHLEAQAIPRFSPPPVLPVDGVGIAARMDRHRWATDRLREGMVAASEERWRAGLGVLAATPAPFSPLTDASRLADALQARAAHALEVRTNETLDERTATYGELLVTCAACHATLAR